MTILFQTAIRQMIRTLLAACLVLFSATILPAETWLEQAQRAVDETAPNSDERLLAMLMLNVAVYNSDFELALAMTDATIELAESLENPNAMAASLMQRARVQCELDSPWASQKDYHRAISLFDGECDPCIRVHYWMARAIRDRHLAESEEIVRYLGKAVEAAELAKDRALRAIVEASLIHRRDPECIELADFKRFAKLSDGVDNHAVTVFSHMFDMFRAAETLSHDELIDHVEPKLEVFEQSGMRGAHIAALNLLGATHLAQQDHERTIACSDLALEQARALKSNYSIAKQLLLRGQWAEAMDNREMALAAYREGVELSLRTNTPLLRNSLYTEAVDQYITNEDWDGLRSMVSSTLDRMRIVDEQRETVFRQQVDTLIADRSAREQALQTAAADLAQKNVSASQRFARWRRFTRNLGVAVLVAFAAYCFFSGLRLHRVNRQLVEQIAEVRRGREAREALEQKVSQIERMDSLGMLAGGVAHDFNNLLIGVLGNAEVLKSDPPEGLAEECVDGIIRSAQAAAELSQKMLTYAGKRTSEKVATDLNELITELLPLLRSGLKAADNIQFKPASEAAVAEIDSSQIEQVLLNLVTNARDVIGDDGKIDIRVGDEVIEDAGSDPTLFGQRTTGGEFVYFDVADNGKGIAPAVVQRMFEPFFTTKSGGRGLGLSVVYGYINKHDGLIRCTSTIGKGTSIRILLPKCAAERLSAVKDEDSDKFFVDDSQSGEFVLQKVPSAPIVIIDDDRQVLDVIQRLLVRQDYPCEILSGGADAIEYLKQLADHVSCVVLDLVMPDVDGEAVLDWMQSNAADVPVVVMTGFSDKNLHEFFKLPNVVGILEKPFSRKQLLVEIKRAVENGRASRLEMS